MVDMLSSESLWMKWIITEVSAAPRGGGGCAHKTLHYSTSSCNLLYSYCSVLCYTVFVVISHYNILQHVVILHYNMLWYCMATCCEIALQHTVLYDTILYSCPTVLSYTIFIEFSRRCSHHSRQPHDVLHRLQRLYNRRSLYNIALPYIIIKYRLTLYRITSLYIISHHRIAPHNITTKEPSRSAAQAAARLYDVIPTIMMY